MRLHALAMATVLAASGCATTGDADPRDPLETMNRGILAFNDAADAVVLIPAARAYGAVLPEGLRGMVRNFFTNLDDLWIGANNLLQGKPADAASDWLRFVFNSTLGFFGLIDLASEVGLEKHNEDLGQTLARWGVGEGPYLMLPLLGPSTTRDTAALPVDWRADPVLTARPIALRNSLTAIRFVARREELLGTTRTLEEAALDRYVFLRESYLQRRKSLVYDGRPPRERPPTE
ncbi:MAG TPA: VacJ family lipoprotein [Burkholderiales bacterium]|nr:VacJ family lipoprotein [Burkholderiales bacterium]